MVAGHDEQEVRVERVWHSSSRRTARRCLKKRHFFTKEGLVIMPHERYLCSRTLGVVQPHQPSRQGDARKHTSGFRRWPRRQARGDQHRFRLALGTLLYISQDRIDIQHGVRNVSQFMALPTKKAEIELKHVISYLKSTENYGLLLPYTKNKSKKAEILSQRPFGGLHRQRLHWRRV